jgi:diguanylate cyclase (GGDEF)-like protein
MQVSENSNEDFLFIDDSADEDLELSNVKGSWKVLIVDDDPEIHSVTQLALSDLVVLNRKLEYFHAYSAQDAEKLLLAHPDIVLVLLDVVMESDDAGLRLVKYIRETLARDDVRIVLRTGQPGYAPEESVIKDYDINDYKTKTELTRRKLVTTVYAAIRSYRQIQIINENRTKLEEIVCASTACLELNSVHEFTSMVLRRTSELFNIKDRMILCSQAVDIIDSVNDQGLYIIGHYEHSDDILYQRIDDVVDKTVSKRIAKCFNDKQDTFAADYTCLLFARSEHKAVVYIEGGIEFGEMTRQLFDVFITNTTIGFENIFLFKQLENAAYKDWLTGLPNRVEFIELLDENFVKQSANKLAALIDIDHFSDVNEGLGQQVGNLLLLSVAQRLTERFGDTCTLSRIGNDVFGIIGDSVNVSPEAITALFEQPFVAGEHSLPVNVTLGLCRREEGGDKGVAVLNHMTIALNLAKKDRQANYHFYAREMEERTSWRLSMISQLRQDFAREKLQLWYQPQLSLETGKVVGCEALLRWKTDDGRFISPATFIPLAEYSGLIIDIGDWVIKQACQQIKCLEQNNFADVTVSINVSIPQFRRSSFVDSLIKTLSEHQVAGERLEIEITENVLIDEPAVMIESLKRLQNQGISIALDDFGTGFSSLSYLQKLPLNRVKIDRSFINEISESNYSIIAEAIISLAKRLGLRVVAEGVEEEVQVNLLKQLQCDEVQGYFYAKPMPAYELLDFLQAHN